MNINTRFGETPCIIRRKKRRSLLFEERADATVKDRKLTHFSTHTSLCTVYSIISFPRNNILSCLNSRLNSSETPWPLHRVRAYVQRVFVSLETRGPRRSFIPTNVEMSLLSRGLCQLCKVPTSDHVSRQVGNIGVEEQRGGTRSVCTSRVIKPIARIHVEVKCFSKIAAVR